MVGRTRRLLCSGLGAAIYLVCTALVFSFIFFEVLDLDGSNFPAKPPAAATPANLAEAGHDVRRASVKALASAWIDLWLLFRLPRGEAVQVQRATAPQAPSPVAPRHHGYRIPLPRASLSDQPA